jgi:amino acid transporter
MRMPPDQGLADVALFFIITGSNLQWVATAAAAGPSSLVVWIIGAVAMFVPIAVVVVYLSSRFPDEGGMNVWSKRAFGPFAGFITGWTYWTSNLPYFPALLYFTAGNALFIDARAHASLAGAPLYFLAVSIARAATRIGWPLLTPVGAVLVVVSCLGSVGAWLGAVARIPFVAGIDHYLPRGFGRMHPRWHSPIVALVAQATIAAGFIVLGQGGTTVKGAYDVLVSMTVIGVLLPFLYLFASAIKLTREPETVKAIRIPGGPRTVVCAAVIGMATTAVSLVLALFPADDDPNKVLAVVKVVGLSGLVLGCGVAAYVAGSRRKSVAAAAPYP